MATIARIAAVSRIAVVVHCTEPNSILEMMTPKVKDERKGKIFQTPPKFAR
jgi:hypothetical protein